MSGVERIVQRDDFNAGRWKGHDLLFGSAAFLFDVGIIVGLSVGLASAYHRIFYDHTIALGTYAGIGLIAALVFSLPFVSRGEYGIQGFLADRHNAYRVATNWLFTFFCLAVIGFFSKTSAQYSRGWLLLFFVTGLLSLICSKYVLRYALSWALSDRRFAPRRIILIGTSGGIDDLIGRIGQHHKGIEIVTSEVIDASNLADANPALDGLLERIANRSRVQSIDDIIVSMPGVDQRATAYCLERLTLLPVGLHLDPGRSFDRFRRKGHLNRLGDAALLSLSEAPLSGIQQLSKRAMDIIVASIALVLLSPVFVLVALLITLDSKGPIFFRQRRNGYNQQEFRIFKFRTMRVADDGDHIVQATANDPRVTRVGRHLRRWSIDELPQLLNVLAGDMSIVGPRPHALAHDRQYEKQISDYTRRQTVRPGITGWAQVHGFRGETDTLDKMRKRVEYDLDYVDNWSIGLDLYIMLLTVISPKTFANAH